jgi:hypothetical protein
VFPLFRFLKQTSCEIEEVKLMLYTIFAGLKAISILSAVLQLIVRLFLLHA